MASPSKSQINLSIDSKMDRKELDKLICPHCCADGENLRRAEWEPGKTVWCVACGLTSSAREMYRVFLETDFWKNIRRLALRRDRNRCVKCNAIENPFSYLFLQGYCESVRDSASERYTKQLHVHHKCYRESWFDTKLEDLITLCEECHQKEHES